MDMPLVPMVDWKTKGDCLASSFKNRRAARGKMEIEGSYGYSSHWFPCVLQDLSTEGAGLKINQTFVPGDLIRLKFGFTHDQRVVEARVVNVSGTRIGVQFVVDSVTQEFVKSVIVAFQRPTSFRR